MNVHKLRVVDYTTPNTSQGDGATSYSSNVGRVGTRTGSYARTYKFPETRSRERNNGRGDEVTSEDSMTSSVKIPNKSRDTKNKRNEMFRPSQTLWKNPSHNIPKDQKHFQNINEPPHRKSRLNSLFSRESITYFHKNKQKKSSNSANDNKSKNHARNIKKAEDMHKSKISSSKDSIFGFYKKNRPVTQDTCIYKTSREYSKRDNYTPNAKKTKVTQNKEPKREAAQLLVLYDSTTKRNTNQRNSTQPNTVHNTFNEPHNDIQRKGYTSLVKQNVSTFESSSSLPSIVKGCVEGGRSNKREIDHTKFSNRNCSCPNTLNKIKTRSDTCSLCIIDNFDSESIKPKPKATNEREKLVADIMEEFRVNEKKERNKRDFRSLAKNALVGLLVIASSPCILTSSIFIPPFRLTKLIRAKSKRSSHNNMKSKKRDPLIKYQKNQRRPQSRKTSPLNWYTQVTAAAISPFYFIFSAFKSKKKGEQKCSNSACLSVKHPCPENKYNVYFVDNAKGGTEQTKPLKRNSNNALNVNDFVNYHECNCAPNKLANDLSSFYARQDPNLSTYIAPSKIKRRESTSKTFSEKMKMFLTAASHRARRREYSQVNNTLKKYKSTNEKMYGPNNLICNCMYQQTKPNKRNLKKVAFVPHSNMQPYCVGLLHGVATDSQGVQCHNTAKQNALQTYMVDCKQNKTSCNRGTDYGTNFISDKSFNSRTYSTERGQITNRHTNSTNTNLNSPRQHTKRHHPTKHIRTQTTSFDDTASSKHHYPIITQPLKAKSPFYLTTNPVTGEISRNDIRPENDCSHNRHDSAVTSHPINTNPIIQSKGSETCRSPQTLYRQIDARVKLSLENKENSREKLTYKQSEKYNLGNTHKKLHVSDRRDRFASKNLVKKIDALTGTIETPVLTQSQGTMVSSTIKGTKYLLPEPKHNKLFAHFREVYGKMQKSKLSHKSKVKRPPKCTYSIKNKPVPHETKVDRYSSRERKHCKDLTSVTGLPVKRHLSRKSASIIANSVLLVKSVSHQKFLNKTCAVTLHQRKQTCTTPLGNFTKCKENNSRQLTLINKSTFPHKTTDCTCQTSKNKYATLKNTVSQTRRDDNKYESLKSVSVCNFKTDIGSSSACLVVEPTYVGAVRIRRHRMPTLKQRLKCLGQSRAVNTAPCLGKTHCCCRSPTGSSCTCLGRWPKCLCRNKAGCMPVCSKRLSKCCSPVIPKKDSLTSLKTIAQTEKNECSPSCADSQSRCHVNNAYLKKTSSICPLCKRVVNCCRCKKKAHKCPNEVASKAVNTIPRKCCCPKKMQPCHHCNKNYGEINETNTQSIAKNSIQANTCLSWEGIERHAFNTRETRGKSNVPETKKTQTSSVRINKNKGINCERTNLMKQAPKMNHYMEKSLKDFRRTTHTKSIQYQFPSNPPRKVLSTQDSMRNTPFFKNSILSYRPPMQSIESSHVLSAQTNQTFIYTKYHRKVTTPRYEQISKSIVKEQAMPSRTICKSQRTNLLYLPGSCAPYYKTQKDSSTRMPILYSECSCSEDEISQSRSRKRQTKPIDINSSKCSCSGDASRFILNDLHCDCKFSTLGSETGSKRINNLSKSMNVHRIGSQDAMSFLNPSYVTGCSPKRHSSSLPYDQIARKHLQEKLEKKIQSKYGQFIQKRNTVSSKPFKCASNSKHDVNQKLCNQSPNDKNNSTQHYKNGTTCFYKYHDNNILNNKTIQIEKPANHKFREQKSIFHNSKSTQIHRNTQIKNIKNKNNRLENHNKKLFNNQANETSKQNQRNDKLIFSHAQNTVGILDVRNNKYQPTHEKSYEYSKPLDAIYGHNKTEILRQRRQISLGINTSPHIVQVQHLSPFTRSPFLKKSQLVRSGDGWMRNTCNDQKQGLSQKYFKPKQQKCDGKHFKTEACCQSSLKYMPYKSAAGRCLDKKKSLKVSRQPCGKKRYWFFKTKKEPKSSERKSSVLKNKLLHSSVDNDNKKPSRNIFNYQFVPRYDRTNSDLNCLECMNNDRNKSIFVQVPSKYNLSRLHDRRRLGTAVANYSINRNNKTPHLEKTPQLVYRCHCQCHQKHKHCSNSFHSRRPLVQPSNSCCECNEAKRVTCERCVKINEPCGNCDELLSEIGSSESINQKNKDNIPKDKPKKTKHKDDDDVKHDFRPVTDAGDEEAKKKKKKQPKSNLNMVPLLTKEEIKELEEEDNKKAPKKTFKEKWHDKVKDWKKTAKQTKEDVNTLEKQAWPIDPGNCKDMYLYTLKNKPCLGIYKKYPNLYPCLINLIKARTALYQICAYILPACLCCPIFACCFYLLRTIGCALT